MRRLLLIASCALLFVPAVAQEVAPDNAYQSGAGAYFAGRTAQAQKQLSAAIEYNPNDPRAYYLRGLNYLAMGNTRQAGEDLAKGAELEARHGSASPQVDHYLSAVQGQSRLTLERFRREARRNAALQQRREVALEYKRAREEREKRVLRANLEFPLEALASQLTVDQARRLVTTTRDLSADDPFGDDAFDESQAFATEPAPPADVPEDASGSSNNQMDSTGGNAATDIGATATDRAPQPAVGEATVDGGFGDNPFESDMFGDEQAGDAGSPFEEEDSSNPFDFGE